MAEEATERGMQPHSALQRHLKVLSVVRDCHPCLSRANVSEGEHVQLVRLRLVGWAVSTSWPALARLDDRHYLVRAAMAAIVHQALIIMTSVAPDGAGLSQPVRSCRLRVHSGLLSPGALGAPGRTTTQPEILQESEQDRGRRTPLVRLRESRRQARRPRQSGNGGSSPHIADAARFAAALPTRFAETLGLEIRAECVER